MPVPDQVRDDVSGIQNILDLLDSGFCPNDNYGIIPSFFEALLK